ncbi:hypothetical protein ALO42_101912 [Pseudomonas syringae pv. atrofaciens]|nr:hypothetical protein ALO42_101912 [Pseudomonas syringae pv. atrofaciens]
MRRVNGECPSDIKILIYDTFISMESALCDAGAKACGRLKA